MNKRLLSLLNQTPIDLILTITVSFIIGLLIIWQAFELSCVIDQVYLGGASLEDVSLILGILLGIIFLRAALSWGSEISANRVAIRIKADLRERLFHHLLELGPTFTKGERTGELSAVATEGIESLDAYFSQYVPQLILSTIVPLAILFVVFPIDPLTGFILLITAPLIPVFMYLIGKAAEALTHRQYDTLRKLSAYFLDSLQGLTTLKQLGQSKSHGKNIEQASDHFRDVTLNVLRVTFLSALVLEMVATLSTAIIAVEVGLRLLYGRMVFEQALFLLVLAPEFYIPLRMLGLRFHAGMSGTAAAKRIFEILDTPINEVAPATPDLSFGSVGLKIESLQFKDVEFSYPGESSPTLTNINIQIMQGQHVALVGATGAGKTTLMNMLLGFANPNSGSVLVNGIDLRNLDTGDWRSHIAWVPQMPHLFHDSMEANIRLANPSASDDQVIAASMAANLHDYVQTLPDGYHTLIGEGGTRLSGGQAQRLAIARAFLKDSPLLILDEPTSNLDPELEMLLWDSIQKLMKDRTVITIAHRMNTVVEADQIIVMDNGQVAESGTHGNLLSHNGKYAALINSDKIEFYSAPEEQKSPFLPQPVELLQEESNTAFIDHELPIPPTKARGPSFEIFKRLLEFMNGSWKWVALSVLLGVVTISANIGLMATSAYLLSSAAQHPSIADLQIAIVGVRFFGIARGVFRYLERLASHTVSFRLLARLRVWFYNALEPLAPARLVTYGSGDLLTRIVGDVNMLENFYVRVISPPMVAIIVTVGMGLFLASYDPVLGWALIVFLLLLGLVVPIISQTVSRNPGRKWVLSRAELQTHLVEDIQGMADLVVFGRQVDREKRLQLIGKQFESAQSRMAIISGANSGLSVLLSNLGMWLILFLAIPLVGSGNIPGVFLTTITLAALASFEAVTPLPLAAQMLGSSLEAAKRLFEVVDAKPAVEDKIDAVKMVETDFDDVEFKNVSFRYEASGVEGLDQVNFNLQEGKSLAVVGSSGAGKSTILQILQRFWDFDSGAITLSSRSIKDFNQNDIRNLFAVVSQNSFFFNSTIRQNLLLANPSASQEQIESATKQAQIHDFIMGLPSGYQTWIGELGARLSGGERQRLAIARALLKDAPILLLDEPTANLDPITERAVLETLWKLMEKRTTLLITHRLIGLDRFDEILVLDKGRIVERGTHSSLIKHDGLYRRLTNLQNQVILAEQ